MSISMDSEGKEHLAPYNEPCIFLIRLFDMGFSSEIHKCNICQPSGIIGIPYPNNLHKNNSALYTLR